MNHEFGIDCHNRSRAGKIVVAIALFVSCSTASAEAAAKTVIAQNRAGTRGGFSREEPVIKSLPSRENIDIQVGQKAYRQEDYETAIRRFKPLAKRGNRTAQYYMGLMYANGYGVSRNPAKAKKWFRKFVERMGTGAAFNLGVMYFRGKSVPQNYRQALFWFKKAAKGGDALSQYTLGFMYDKGYGVPEDRVEAIWWYRKAAKKGFLKAQKALGAIYSEGRMSADDYVQAYFWYNVAAQKGDKSAAAKRDALGENMTSSQIAEAIRLTHQWQLSSGHSGTAH